MTLEQIEQAYDAALIAERVARITARHAELELIEAQTKLTRALHAYAEATLTPEQARYREWYNNKQRETATA